MLQVDVRLAGPCARRLVTVRRPDAALLERACKAACLSHDYMSGVAAMERWAAAKVPEGNATDAAVAAMTTAAAATAVARRAGQLRSRLVSLGAAHWKDQAGGREQMMAFVRLMGGEQEQRAWLSRCAHDVNVGLGCHYHPYHWPLRRGLAACKAVR